MGNLRQGFHSSPILGGRGDSPGLQVSDTGPGLHFFQLFSKLCVQNPLENLWKHRLLFLIPKVSDSEFLVEPENVLCLQVPG